MFVVPVVSRADVTRAIAAHAGHRLRRGHDVQVVSPPPQTFRKAARMRRRRVEGWRLLARAAFNPGAGCP
jgi:hypothetical protein